MPKIKCDASALKKGDRLSRTSYMEVVGVSGDTVEVKNEDGVEWSISKKIVAAECLTANQAAEEIKVTRTELIEIFSKVGDKIFTANFCKQPKIEDVFDEVANTGKLKKNADMKKDLKKAMEGQPRTVIGYLIKTETGFGRSMVVDLEKPNDPNKDYDTRIMQVDHRSLNWLIVEDKKYVEKNFKEPKTK